MCIFYPNIFRVKRRSFLLTKNIFNIGITENIKLKLWNVSAESGRDCTDNDEGPMDSPM